MVATARDPHQLDELVDRYGNQVRAVALDVTDPVAARLAVQAALDARREEHLPRLRRYARALINNRDLAEVLLELSHDVFGQLTANSGARPAG